MKWSLIFLFCLLSFQQAFAQDQVKIDSLTIKLNAAKEDTSKVKLLLDLSDVYGRTDLMKSLKYATDALQTATNTKSDLFIARSYLKIGTNLILIGNYDKALKNVISCLKISRKNKFEYEEFVSINYLGLIQDGIGKYDNALKYYFEALEMYNKSIESGKPIKGRQNVQRMYNNIGNIYLSKEKFSTAEEYYLKGLTAAEKQDDYINIGVICNNLGKMEIQRRNYPKAYNYLIKSLTAREKINDKSGIAKSYNILARYFQAINQLNEAQEYSKKALSLGTEINEQSTVQTAASFLYETYESQGRIDKAFEYLKLYKKASDSLINVNKIEEITRLQVQYEYENLEKEKAARQQILKYTYIIIVSVLILGLIIIGLLYFLSKSRNKRIQLEKEKLEKDMIVKNKELTTNVLYLLQKNELIINIISRLLKLKDKLKAENVEPVQRIIHDLQSLTDKEVWKEFEIRFQDVHEEFYQNLKQRYPDLSPSDIKLAAFLRLNMTTKEIASITGQTVTSLEVARYRLRKKLGITNQEVNLVNFLLNN